MSDIRKDGPYSWVFLTATVVVSFTLIGLVDSTGIIVAVFIDQLNASNAKGGWIGSIIFFLALALSPVVVYIHRQFGFRWCMLISSVFYGFSVSVTPFITKVNLVFLTYSIPLGVAGSFLATLSIITQQEYFSKHFGFAIGVRFSANSLGAMAISFALPITFAELGYKVTFLCLLVFAPLTLCYGFVARHQAVKDTDINRSKKSIIDLYREILQDKSFTICLVGSALYFSTCIIPMVFMVRYGVTLGYPLSKAKWLMVIRQLTTFISRLIAGRVSDIALRHGQVKTLLQINFILFGVLNCICSFLRSFSVLLVYMALIGIVDGVWWVTCSLLVMEITGGYCFNEAFSLFYLIGAFAVLFGPPAAGWIFDQTNDFRYVFYTAFGTSLLAALLLTISSCVRIDKELSLVEKSKQREVESFELVADRTHSTENVVGLAYETAV